MTVNSVNTYIVPTVANEVTMPSQPAFLAYLANDDNDVTGNGTLYQLGTTGNALTEIFDQNADFNVNGTFTSPVTGRYYLTSTIEFLQAAAGTTAQINIVTSNRTYTYEDGCDTNVNTNGSIQLAALADMDAADTAIITALVNGIGLDTADVDGTGAAIPRTWYCGNLTV